MTKLQIQIHHIYVDIDGVGGIMHMDNGNDDNESNEDDY